MTMIFFTRYDRPLASGRSQDRGVDLAVDPEIAHSIDTWNRIDLSARSVDCCHTWADSAGPGTGDRCKKTEKIKKLRRQKLIYL